MRALWLIAFICGLLAGNAPGWAEEAETYDSERDPSLRPAARNEFAANWYYGGRLQFDIFLEEDYDLDGDARDRIVRLRPQVRGTLRYEGAKFSALANLRFSQRSFVVDQDDSRDNVTDLFLDELYFTVRNIAKRLDLSLGRFQIKDERNFLYQRRLDGIRLDYRWQGGSAYLTVNSRDIFPRNLIDEPEQDRVINYILYADQEIARGHKIATYVIVRDNTDVAKDRPVFVGLRAMGTLAGQLDYWGEFSMLTGTTPDPAGVSLKNSSIGFDIGGTYRFEGALQPSITLSFAFGGGDSDPGDAKNKAFRQTGIGGLAQNRGILNGTTFFNYYGELFQPNLSNLAILTLGAGFRPWPNSSVDVIFHNYRQDVAAPSVGVNQDPEFLTGLDPQPTGLSRDLGSEIDLIAGYKEISGWELELAFSVFFPGSAYAVRSQAYQAKTRVKYNF